MILVCPASRCDAGRPPQGHACAESRSAGGRRAIVEDGAWLGKLHGELRGLLAPVFAQARLRSTAFAYVGALLAERGDRKSCWQRAEEAEHATPRRMQPLLAEHAWDWKTALRALQRFIVARLGDPEAIVVLDETAELKEGTRTVGWSGGMPGLPDRWRTARRSCSWPTSPPGRTRCSIPALPAEGLVRSPVAAGMAPRPGRRAVRHQAHAGHRGDRRRGGAVRVGGRR